MLRARLGLSDVGLVYDMTVLNDPIDLPPEAAFSRAFPQGMIGVSGGAEFWPGRGDFGAEVRGRVGGYSLAIGEADYSDSLGAWLIGARYRYGLLNDAVHAQAGLGYHRSSVVLFRYAASDAASPDLLHLGVGGLRSALGASYTLGKLYASAEAAITWAPWPVDRYLGLNVEYEVFQGIHANVGAEVDFRTVTLDVGTQEVEINDRQGGFYLGASYAL
jgi:hypothetical protein